MKTESVESDLLEAPRSNSLIKIPGQNKTDKIFIDGDIPDSVDINDPTAFINWLTMNSAKLQLVFLGTSCWYPTYDRNLPSVAIRTSGDTWLFDVGTTASSRSNRLFSRRGYSAAMHETPSAATGEDLENFLD